MRLRGSAWIGFKQEIMELIPWLVAVYTVICVGAYFGNRLFMYLPDPTRVAPTEAGLESVEEIEIAGSDGVAVVAWHAPAKEDKPTVPYFHGNAANAANRAPKIETIREKVSAFSTSTTAVMADRAGDPRKRTMLPTPTIT